MMLKPKGQRKAFDVNMAFRIRFESAKARNRGTETWINEGRKHYISGICRRVMALITSYETHL